MRFPAEMRGYSLAMIDTKSIPQPGERWLGCPPFTLVAHIVRIDDGARPPLVSYKVLDEDGAVLEEVEHAVLDEGWWRAFQPMRMRWG